MEMILFNKQRKLLYMYYFSLEKLLYTVKFSHKNLMKKEFEGKKLLCILPSNPWLRTNISD
jgi:hypothetical protein